ncbi:MAG TPA: YkgJ family cysteine cluster protein [Gammaproteobacteria bacterium]
MMECRHGCGACCIAPSISSPIPGMLDGKPAGTRCVQLSEANLCLLWRNPSRPAVCSSFSPSQETCGNNRDHAMSYLSQLEAATRSNGLIE